MVLRILIGDVARGFGRGGIEAIEEEGDEMFGFGFAGDEMEVGKVDRGAVVSHGEVGGFEVEDGLVLFVADNEVEGDFIDGGGELGAAGSIGAAEAAVWAGAGDAGVADWAGTESAADRKSRAAGRVVRRAQGGLRPKLKHCGYSLARMRAGTVVAEPERALRVASPRYRREPGKGHKENSRT